MGLGGSSPALHEPYLGWRQTLSSSSDQGPTVAMTDGVRERLAGMEARHTEVCEILSQPGLTPADMAKYGKELSELEPVVGLYRQLRELSTEGDNLHVLKNDSSEEPEMRELAESEFRELDAKVKEIESELVLALLPKNTDDTKDVIVEVRAGAGGDEGALFAMDLFQMYKRFASIKGWRFEELEVVMTGEGLGGCKIASAALSGESVYSQLKFENGVHRVQRVPQTETQGRVHTSTATVVVMPQAEEVDVEVREADIRVDVFRASGAGGQHVNTTESAVRMTHIPTGITVSMQDERSQHKNRAKAIKVLRARVYNKEREKAQQELSQQRTSAGTGDRSERIRTYNFKEGRVTDHRVGLTEHGMDAMLGGELLGNFLLVLAFKEKMELIERMEHAAGGSKPRH
mmetsp:Transcript_11372/g.32288  ORF Transcript_11372/g.32288 Transcript_11372/m.32288 type:complete len:403 (-) Transcript_11372:548-1756(-)